MKIRSLLIGAAALALPIIGLAGVAAANTAGQIEFGDIYRVRNVTQGGEFTDPANADKCETVQFKVRIHNPGPDALTGVKVGATLPTAAAISHSSQVTVSADNANPKSVNDTAAVKLPAAYKISYVAGSTQLLDANNGVMQTLPDGIVGGQVSIPGGVGVSTQQKRFVQFQAKIECPEKPPVVSTGVCKVVTVEVTSPKQREVKVTVSGEVNNATITAYRVNFGDGTSATSQTATHTYAQDGTYTIRGYVTVKYANGTSEEKSADACAQQVTFNKEQPPEVVPPVTPPANPPVTPVATPTVLPETGIGGIAAIFGAVSSISAAAYYAIARRS